MENYFLRDEEESMWGSGPEPAWCGRWKQNRKTLKGLHWMLANEWATRGQCHKTSESGPVWEKEFFKTWGCTKNLFMSSSPKS